jgi:hypothetical protein
MYDANFVFFPDLWKIREQEKGLVFGEERSNGIGSLSWSGRWACEWPS